MEKERTRTHWGARLAAFLAGKATYVVVIAVVLILAARQPFMLSVLNIVSMLGNATPLLIVSVGVTFVIVSKQLDLSTGSIALTCASIGGVLMSRLGWNPVVCLLLYLVIGALLGLLNGLMIVKLSLHPWLVTLGMQLLLKGFSYTLTQTATITLPDSVKVVRSVRVGPVPLFIILALVFTALMQYVLKYTKFGRYVIAVGSNREAAERLGMPVGRTRILVMMICGFCCGLSAIMSTINVGSISQYTGRGYEFLAVTTVVLGGTSMAGGAGSVFPGTLFGVLVISLLENGLSINGVNPYVFNILRGVIIFAAMLTDTFKERINNAILHNSSERRV